jgi:hypothetical protein
VLVTPAGDKGDDVLIGRSARDHIYTGDPDGSDHPGGDVDVVRSGLGDDLIFGASVRADVAVIEGGPGADELVGVVGFDIASYAGSASAVTGTVGGPVSGGDATGDRFEASSLIGSRSDTLTGGRTTSTQRGRGGVPPASPATADGGRINRISPSPAAVVVNLSKLETRPTGAGSDTLRDREHDRLGLRRLGPTGREPPRGGPATTSWPGSTARARDGGDGVDLAKYARRRSTA